MYIIFSVITLVFNIFFSVFGGTMNKIGGAASVEYVNTENIKQDVLNKESINDLKHNKVNREEFDIFTASFSKTLETMDKRIYDIWINRDGK